MIDTLIEGGRILDGAGNPEFRADVGVNDGRVVVFRGDTAHIDAVQRIDARGMVVTPGFIDMHSHSGLMLFADPLHEPKIRQGVTTEVIGVDGCSYAPFPDGNSLWDFVRMNAGLDGRPDIDYSWRTVAEYLSMFDRSVSVNIAYMLGNSALRICTIGWGEEPATARHIADMRALLREGMQEGAFGLSTGLDYPPGSFASTSELTELADEAARLGGIYHTHVRYQLGDRFLDPFREALDIGRGSGSPIHLTHLYRRATAPGGATKILDLVEGARDEGLDVTFDSYPYEWSSTRLLILVPMWAQVGGADKLLERLTDPVEGRRIRVSIDERSEQYGGPHVWDRIRLGYFRSSENAAYEGQTIRQVADERGQSPAEAICDLLISEDLSVNEVAAGPDPVSLPRFAAHPLGMVGTDSVFLGDKPSPRTYGSFPRILGELVREERMLSLPEAIRKMTSYPAQRMGLEDRGLLRDGMVADIAVFDPDRINPTCSYEAPRSHAVGMHHVLVDGQPVLLNGVMTGATPGRSLKHGRHQIGPSA